MEAILEFLKTDTFLIINGIVLCILFIGFFIMLARLHSINKHYKTFLKKLGNGENIEEDLENYMYRVERVEKLNVREVIIATNPDADGETTASYIGKILQNKANLKVTKLASGIPIGSHLEYADEITVLRALENRVDLS